MKTHMEMILVLGLLTFSPGIFGMECAPLKELPGVLPPGSAPVFFKTTVFSKKTYGVKYSYFYGDWSWRADFNQPSYPVTPLGNETIARLAAACLTSSPVGRIHRDFLVQQSGESDEAYLTRILDELLQVKRELLEVQQTLDAKLTQFEPKGINPDYRATYHQKMDAALIDALNGLKTFADSNLLYLIESMNRYQEMNQTLVDSLALTRDFISEIGKTPDADLWAFDNLKNDTHKVRTTYGLFFGEAARQQLNEALQKVDGEVGKVDVKQLKADLEAWAATFEEVLQGAFDRQSPYFQAASRLRFIFGTRDPRDLATAVAAFQTLLGQPTTDDHSPIALLFKKVPNDTKYWEGVHVKP